MTKYYFVRHGEPDYKSISSWEHIPLGKEFAGLTENGRIQLEKTATRLQAIKPQVILSSPYTRSLESAAILSRVLDIPIHIEQGLHEWESDLSHEIKEPERLLALCKEHDAFHGIYPENQQPLWESTEMIRQRVMEAISHYSSYERVVVSGHAMMMQAILETEQYIEYGEIMEYIMR